MGTASVSRYCQRVYRDENQNAIDDTKLVGNEQPLSTSLPKPNVVRIEVLPSYVRQSFLGGYYSKGDAVKANLMAAGTNKDSYLPFYGIAAGDMSAPSFGVSASWNPSKKQGFSHMMGLISKAAGMVSDTLSNGVSGAHKVIQGSEKMMNQWLGIDNVSTGTSTIKTLGGVSMSISAPIKVTWYMPEQSQMCRIGIERLINLAYVHGLGGDYASEQAKMMNEAVGEVVNKASSWTPDSTLGHAVKGTAMALGLGDEAMSVFTKENIQGTIETIKAFNKFFGGNMTINPLPVRVSIGHIINMEPMVIRDVNFTCSPEQFIADDGSHIPIFVHASISVEPWMNPGPDKQFFSFIGDEVFASKNEGV